LTPVDRRHHFRAAEVALPFAVLGAAIPDITDLMLMIGCASSKRKGSSSAPSCPQPPAGSNTR
jgi:hypothetical protein